MRVRRATARPRNWRWRTGSSARARCSPTASGPMKRIGSSSGRPPRPSYTTLLRSSAAAQRRTRYVGPCCGGGEDTGFLAETEPSRLREPDDASRLLLPHLHRDLEPPLLRLGDKLAPRHRTLHRNDAFWHAPAGYRRRHDRGVPSGALFHRREPGALVILVDQVHPHFRVPPVLSPGGEDPNDDHVPGRRIGADLRLPERMQDVARRHGLAVHGHRLEP